MSRIRVNDVVPREAVAFVRDHGVVLESAKGVVPSLAVAIAGEPIHGNWWGHPRSHEIFACTRAVRESNDVLVCRLVGGKVTFVHRERWPALVRCADHFPSEHLAQIEERHTSSGHHVKELVLFPEWVPTEILEASEDLSEEHALRILGSWAT